MNPVSSHRPSARGMYCGHICCFEYLYTSPGNHGLVRQLPSLVFTIYIFISIYFFDIYCFRNRNVWLGRTESPLGGLPPPPPLFSLPTSLQVVINTNNDISINIDIIINIHINILSSYSTSTIFTTHIPAGGHHHKTLIYVSFKNLNVTTLLLI